MTSSRFRVPRAQFVFRFESCLGRGVALTAAVLLSAALRPALAQQPSGEPLLQLVSGDGYEGVIIPAGSGWHGLFRLVLNHASGVGDPSAAATPWTPQVSDIAPTERVFSALLERLATSTGSALAELPGEDRGNVERDLRSLLADASLLKRQYWGFELDGHRRVAVHAEPDDPQQRWRTERVPMLDGGCRNVWYDVDLTEQKIVRLTCGGFA